MKSRNSENYALIHTNYITNVRKPIMPTFYIIEPTNFCNYACTICPNRLYDLKNKGKMAGGLFLKIIDQICEYADVIQLYWVGEPLLHSGIFDMISYCECNTSAKIMISTNGSLLSESVIIRLIESGLDKLIVSMDANESKTIYSSIRTNGDISLLNSNVEKLMLYADKLDITLQFVLTDLNQAEKDAFINKWSKYPVKISIQCLYSWANQLAELNEMSHFLSPMIGKERVPCSDLWYKMSIHWNGKVSRCCFDWSFDNVVGDLNDQSVFDVWNSNKMTLLRECHKKLTFDSLCSKCDAWAEEKEYETLFD